MNAWWAGLAPRERIILMIGSIMLLLIIFWLMVLEPIADRRAGLRAEVVALSSDYQFMQQHAVEVRRRAGMQRNNNTAAAGAGSVLTLVEVSANAAGIKSVMDRVQPEGQGARLWFEQVGFDQLLAWLSELEQRQGLAVSQIAVDAGSQPGMVAARILVEPR